MPSVERCRTPFSFSSPMVVGAILHTPTVSHPSTGWAFRFLRHRVFQFCRRAGQVGQRSFFSGDGHAGSHESKRNYPFVVGIQRIPKLAAIVRPGLHKHSMSRSARVKSFSQPIISSAVGGVCRIVLTTLVWTTVVERNIVLNSDFTVGRDPKGSLAFVIPSAIALFQKVAHV